MSYLDQDRRSRPSSIAMVVLAHAAIGYGLVSGLAYTVVSHIPLVTRADIIPDDTPPPPHPVPPATARTSAPLRPAPTPLERPLTPPTLGDVIVVPLSSGDVTVPTFPADNGAATVTPTVRTGKAHGAVAAANRAGWVTADDYPASALREGVEGTVELIATVRADGRVGDCRVTSSSGNALLDGTTCRLYARRARFTPAVDDQGRAIASQRADRIRWTIPEQ